LSGQPGELLPLLTEGTVGASAALVLLYSTTAKVSKGEVDDEDGRQQQQQR
jgi:hypothetical protein